jgi:hypothetical protein
VVDVIVRRGVGRDVVAGVIWALLRLEHSCLSASDIVEALKEIGVRAGHGVVYRC